MINQNRYMIINLNMISLFQSIMNKIRNKNLKKSDININN